jgi:hypothetical protein
VQRRIDRRLPLVAILATAACAPLPQREPRAAHSSLECMHAAMQDRLPAGLPDSQLHCIATGLIARYCSVTEASLAGIGKELKDLLGPGDAEWRDLVSDRHGIECARTASTNDDLLQCCLR